MEVGKHLESSPLLICNVSQNRAACCISKAWSTEYTLHTNMSTGVLESMIAHKASNAFAGSPMLRNRTNGSYKFHITCHKYKELQLKNVLELPS